MLKINIQEASRLSLVSVPLETKHPSYLTMLTRQSLSAHTVLPASPSNVPVTIQETPRCSEYPECATCAEDGDCAWCASAGACMTVSEIFSVDCRGTVFDLPCPDSFVGGESQVVKTWGSPRDFPFANVPKTVGGIRQVVA